MARIVKQHEYAVKRNEILAAAQRLIYAKGYERMTVQDILQELKISSGAFYHYFDSKPALLEAFIELIRTEVEKPLLPIVHDPHLTALQKLQGFFDTLDRLRIARRAEVVSLGRTWYADENAIVRQKVDAAIIEQRAPHLNAIVRQGLQESVFTIPHPEQAGTIILSLLHGMGNTHAGLLLSLAGQSPASGSAPPDFIADISARVVDVYDAYMEAIERVLGAPTNSLRRTDLAAVNAWVAAILGV